MSLQPKLNDSHYQLLEDVYLSRKMSTREISKESQKLFGFFVAPSGIYSALMRLGIDRRSVSEGVSIANTTLDPSISHLCEPITEWIDGFLLGDGSIGTVSKNRDSFRFTMGSTEDQWTRYAMSGLTPYQPSEPRQSGKVSERTPNICWLSSSLIHPDITIQRHRWYPNGKKIVPQDVRITSTSIRLWYLGDGSLCNARSNFTMVRFATCSFEPSEIEGILIPKLKALGLECIRETSKNDIRICPESIGTFFDLIGRESPIPCYARKFAAPDWLFLHRLEDIANTPKERWRAIYHIRKGSVQCTSSPGGKMFLFDDEQAAKLRILLDDTGR